MRITLCLALLLLVAASACSSSESEDLYDVWITPGNSIYLSLNEDDSWGIAYHEGIDPFDWGTFTFDDELLTFFIDPDSVSCYTTGTYEAAFTAEGDLELNVVEDPCRLRAEDLTGTLVRSSIVEAAPTTTVEATTTTTVADSTTTTAATHATTVQESGAPATGIYGVWLSSDGSIYMSLNENDSFGISHGEGTDPIEWGAFAFDGELLTLSTDPDSKSCGKTVGTYQAAFTADGDLQLTDVEDPCTARRVDLSDPEPNTDVPHNTGTLVRISP